MNYGIQLYSLRDITKDNLEKALRQVAEMGYTSEGMKLYYHNHSHEFIKNASGQITQDELASRTEILFELDTFWVYNSMLDPVEMMEKYKNRMEFIHFKDGIAQDWSIKGSHAQGRSVGNGIAPALAVRKKAIELGVDMIIEREGLDPTGPEEVRRCIDFLKKVDENEN